MEDFSDLGHGEGDLAGVSAALPNHIYMDAMGFGMGCCCLQMTFQACNIDEARLLYDQLTPMCPILVTCLLHLTLAIFTSLLSGQSL